jgi:hypothetical protein
MFSSFGPLGRPLLIFILEMFEYNRIIHITMYFILLLIEAHLSGQLIKFG